MNVILKITFSQLFLRLFLFSGMCIDNIIEASFVTHMFDFIELITPHIRTFKQLVTMKPEWMNSIQLHYLSDGSCVQRTYSVPSAYRFGSQDQIIAHQELSECAYSYISLCVVTSMVITYAAYKYYNCKK